MHLRKANISDIERLHFIRMAVKAMRSKRA